MQNSGRKFSAAGVVVQQERKGVQGEKVGTAYNLPPITLGTRPPDGDVQW